MAKRYTRLRYPEKFTSKELAEDHGRRFKKMYYRLLGREPVFEASATESFVRELELQAAMGFGSPTEIQRALLAQQPEFHNKPGRPTGSKTKNRRNPPKPETEISKAAKRQRRKRSKKA
jgi:hypothetical protein